MRNKKSDKKPKIIKITQEQLAILVDAINASNLSKEWSDMIIDNISGNNWLVDSLEKGRLTIKKLRELFNITTESRSKRKKNNHFTSAMSQEDFDHDMTDNNVVIDGDSGMIISSAPNKKIGHGRLAADAYHGAEVWDIIVQELQPGDTCPEEACDGRLYEMSDPGVFIQIIGQPVAKAVRYNLQKLRCSVCEIIITAPLPEGIEAVKYTLSIIVMLMIHKYFMSMPLYRQEKLQKYLGVPMPASTQWDLMAAQEDVLAPLYKAFEYDAAQGKGIAIDDTSAKILEQIAKNKKADKKSDKASCYTTGVVSVHDDHMSYIFITDNKTAGKSAVPFLRLRNDALPAPYLMCDALTANIPEGISSDLYILCYCLVHARRQFYQLPDGYDDLADEVMGMIGKIYDHEEHTRNNRMNAEARLAYHQQHSAPVMLALKTYLLAQEKEFEPNGVAGNAIQYMLKRWTELTQFLRHPHVPLDNNMVERALKLIIQVRKSSMFYKTLKSAKIASYIQTALYSAAQNDVNPYDYMMAILRNKEAVIKNPHRWLPWNYTAEEGSCRHDACISPGVP